MKSGWQKFKEIFLGIIALLWFLAIIATFIFRIYTCSLIPKLIEPTEEVGEETESTEISTEAWKLPIKLNWTAYAEAEESAPADETETESVTAGLVNQSLSGIKCNNSASVSAEEIAAEETESSSSKVRETEITNASSDTVTDAQISAKIDNQTEQAAEIITTQTPVQTSAPITSASTTAAPITTAATTVSPTTEAPAADPDPYGCVNGTAYYSRAEYEAAYKDYWTAVAYSGVDYTEQFIAQAEAAGYTCNVEHNPAKIAILKAYAYEMYVNGNTAPIENDTHVAAEYPELYDSGWCGPVDRLSDCYGTIAQQPNPITGQRGTICVYVVRGYAFLM